MALPLFTVMPSAQWFFPQLLLSLATLVLYHQFLVASSCLAIAFGVLNPTTPHSPPFVRSVLRQVTESPTDCVFCLYDAACSTDLISVVVFTPPDSKCKSFSTFFYRKYSRGDPRCKNFIIKKRSFSTLTWSLLAICIIGVHIIGPGPGLCVYIQPDSLSCDWIRFREVIVSGSVSIN